MFLLTKPTGEFIADFLRTQQDAPYSYDEIGQTNGILPTGYDVDHNRIKLGEGTEVFEKAVRAMRNWQMFATGWTRICRENTPLAKDAVVAVLVNHFGFWSLNPTRIVYLVAEDREIRKFGFAYGTLAEHSECGEERFLIEYLHRDNSVWYDILAFSKPHNFLARIGYPVARHLQKQFAADSKKAMFKAVQEK